MPDSPLCDRLPESNVPPFLISAEHICDDLGQSRLSSILRISQMMNMMPRRASGIAIIQIGASRKAIFKAEIISITIKISKIKTTA